MLLKLNHLSEHEPLLAKRLSTEDWQTVKGAFDTITEHLHYLVHPSAEEWQRRNDDLTAAIRLAPDRLRRFA